MGEVEQHIESAKRWNWGLSALKLLSCFMVVGIHEGWGIRGNTYAVPIFMVIAFFLSANMIMNCRVADVKRRIFKILIPLWFWSLFSGVIFVILGESPSGFAILSQLMLGHSYVKPLWFLPCLAVITLLMLAMKRLMGRWFYEGMMILLVGSLLAQYSSFPTALKRLPVEISFPLGRFVEMIPCAICGLALARFSQLFPKIDKRGLVVAAIALLALLVQRVLPDIDGFGYGGVLRPAIAMLVVYVSLLIGSYINIKICLPQVSSGIYYSHYLIGCMLPISGGCVKTVLVFCLGAILTTILLRSRQTRCVVV